MHRARMILIPGGIMEPTEDCEEPAATERLSSSEEVATQPGNSENEEVASKPSELQESLKLGSISVTVPEPSQNKVRDGKIHPFGVGRSRSSSTRARTNSLKALFVKDTWSKAELYLTDTKLCYKIEGMGVCKFFLEDVIGIQVSQTPPQDNLTACEFNVHLFLVNNPLASSRFRMQCTALIVFDRAEDFKGNLRLAKEWKTKVLKQTRKAVKAEFVDAADSEGDSEHGDSQTSSNLELSEEHSVLLPRRLLVFINPMAGSQNGKRLFEKHVKKMFDLAEIQYVVEVTEYQNHAREMITTYNLSEIDGIIISSGDGLVHEVLNGIMARRDWETAIKTPIGVLPTGSGNALCASTLYESKEDYSLEMAAFQIARGGVGPMDLATVQLSDGTSLFMTIMAGWGMIADVDIESEKFRKLGKARFTLGALSCIVKKRVYKGKLSYVVVEGTDKEPERVPYEPPKRDEDSSSSSSLESGSESPALSNRAAGPSGGNGEGTDSVPPSSPPPVNPPPTDLLVPLDQPLPPEIWTTKEDEYLTINPLMISHLSSDFFGDPEFSIGTGTLRLTWVDSRITRKGTLNLMTSAESGRHIEMPEVYRIDVKAFRLEPLSPPGILTVDGEKVRYGPIQAQVHPRLARIMSRKRKI